ncbi:MAG TPA: DUF2277 domain-containing protein [Actinomycetota bacterium]|nr:DUF2277 domain-containing protein [Actinomycetota bacterium]
MCRSIKKLRGDEAVGEEQVREAALQYVRKISGFRAPSKANTEAFDEAVDEVKRISERLLERLSPPA